MVKNKIVDCDKEIEFTPKSFSGSAGSKFGVYYNDKDRIMKLPRNGRYFHDVNISYNTSPLSEYLGSHIYEILGFDVHETLLGTYKNKVVVLCKNFDPIGNRLHEFKNIKNYFDDEDVMNDDSDSTVLSDILKVISYSPLIIDKEATFERFWDMFLIDAFINNNDRNNGNWGFLFDSNNLENWKIAPIYDNGNSFNNKLGLEDINRRLKSDETMKNIAIYSVVSAFKDDENHRINPFKLIYLKNIDDLNKSVIRNVFKININYKKILNFIENIPNKSQNGVEIISDAYKRLIKISLNMRMEEVLLPVFNELMQYDEYKEYYDSLNTNKNFYHEVELER